MKVKIKKTYNEAITPTYGSNGAAGMDLHSTGTKLISPKETKSFGTGIAMEIPEGFVGLVFNRSGLSTKKGVSLINCVAVIDSDYRGEIHVPLHNHSHESYKVEKGDRIAQMIILPYPHIELEEVDSLDDTERGTGGFGSTGV